MEPTYKLGEVVSVDEKASVLDSLRVGDVVVFHPPAGADTGACGVQQPPGEGCPTPTAARSSTRFIKRIVAVGGDTIYIRDNRVSRNGAPEHEPYVNATTQCADLCNLPKPIRVAPGTFYVLGDNRGESADSRVWGPVARKWIIGKVLAR